MVISEVFVIETIFLTFVMQKQKMMVVQLCTL